MNARIKELYSSAWIGLVRDYDDTNDEDFRIAVTEKFAELIVRECGEFTDHVTRKLMMKHFGVE